MQVYAVLPRGLDPRYLLGLLNSKLLSYLFRLRFQAKRLAGGYLAINKSQLAQLPIRICAAEDPEARDLERQLVELVERLQASAAEAATAARPTGGVGRRVGPAGLPALSPDGRGDPERRGGGRPVTVQPRHALHPLPARETAEIVVGQTFLSAAAANGGHWEVERGRVWQTGMSVTAMMIRREQCNINTGLSRECHGPAPWMLTLAATPRRPVR